MTCYRHSVTNHDWSSSVAAGFRSMQMTIERLKFHSKIPNGCRENRKNYRHFLFLVAPYTVDNRIEFVADEQAEVLKSYRVNKATRNLWILTALGTLTGFIFTWATAMQIWWNSSSAAVVHCHSSAQQTLTRHTAARCWLAFAQTSNVVIFSGYVFPFVFFVSYVYTCRISLSLSDCTVYIIRNASVTFSYSTEVTSQNQNVLAFLVR